MGAQRLVNSDGRIWRRLLSALVLTISLAGCAGVKTTSAGETEQTLWQARDQYVTVVPQENGAAVNQQPVSIPVGELQRLLGSIQLLKGDNQPAQPLFTASEVQTLADAVSTGLSQAGPREDISFVIIGYYPTLMGLAKEMKVTTGRIFYADARLNLILGAAQGAYDERQDRRLYPLLPGSRVRTADLGGRIVAAHGTTDLTLKRDDWLQFPYVPGQTPVVAPATQSAPVPTTAEPPRATPVEPTIKHHRSIEERLQILKGLKEKGLITDDEFNAKRKEILDQL